MFDDFNAGSSLKCTWRIGKIADDVVWVARVLRRWKFFNGEKLLAHVVTIPKASPQEAWPGTDVDEAMDRQPGIEKCLRHSRKASPQARCRAATSSICQ
jgi:hypothetical protein